MPFIRYQIRNEYSLADPELYKTADKDDPEALLEGVAMAGLVGVLRQLGDLAEFAAEIFHGLHEEVMVTAARGHGLLVRVQQLESEFPSIERAFLSQTSHSAFFSSSGIGWHPNLQTEQNLITRGDLPRFVMDSYEECRGPPRLFLLDKFDVAGAGACLKRYTDPSFYKVEPSSYEMTSTETQRDKKIRKTKKRGSRWKNGETPEVLQPSHVKLHQLLLEERVQNGVSEPARHVKLKKRQTKFPFDTEDGKGYMEKLLSSPSEDKLVHEVPFSSSPLRLPTNNSGESRLEILEVSTINSPIGSPRQNRSPRESPSVNKTVSMPENVAEQLVQELPSLGLETEVEQKHISVDGESKTDGYQSDDIASETDNFVDALTTMESENETDAELRANSDPSINPETCSDENVEKIQSQSSDSDGGSSSIRKKITSFSYSDTTSTSATSLQAFACTEIPFHPRVCIEVRSDAAFPVDQGAIFKESTSRESDLKEMSSNNSVDLNSPRRREENQFDPEAIIASPDDPSSSFVRNPECVADNEDHNSNSSPVIHLTDTTCGIGESSSSKVNEADSIDSRCSSPHSVISHVEEQPFSRSLEEVDICEPDVKPSETSPSGDSLAAEEKAYSPDTCYLPKEKLKDDVLMSISDLVSYSSEDETELKERTTKDATADVSDPTDVYRNGDNGLSTLKDEKELEKREPGDVDNNESKGGLFTCEDDTELEEREVESIDSETEDATFAVDVEKNECNGLYNPEEPGENGFEAGEKKDLNEQSVISPEFYDTASYDHSNIQLFDIIPKSSAATFSGMNENDVDNPSANLIILQDRSQFVIEKTDQNGLQTDVDSQPGNSIPNDQSNNQFLDSDPNSPVSTESQTGLHLDNILESKSLNQDDHIDKLEATPSISSHSVHIEENVDQPHMQSLLQLEQVDSENHADHETHVDTHSETYPVIHESDHLEQGKESQGDLASITGDSTLQHFVPVSEELSMPDLPQSSSHINLSAQVEYPLAPVFSGFGMLPQLAPINLEEEAPPLPPLPPMQWRMGKLQNAPLTSSPDGQHSIDHFPPIFPQIAIYPSLDQNENTANQESEHDYENTESSSHVLPTESSLDTKEDDKSFISSEVNVAKFSEHMVPQPPFVKEQSQNVSTSGREIFWPSSTSSLPSVDDERPNGIRPMKIQRPRTPLIDAVAAHDKSKLRKVPERAKPDIPKEEERDTLLQLRKVSERARPDIPKEEERDTLLQLRKVSERARPDIPKEEERDTLLEQIRAKSFNLKPAVQTRPSIQGPTTNLRVAAILEKANAIRQAFAGSDDDEDDEDSWSDS